MYLGFPSSPWYFEGRRSNALFLRFRAISMYQLDGLLEPFAEPTSPIVNTIGLIGSRPKPFRCNDERMLDRMRGVFNLDVSN